jgi:hypothetical protein
MEGKTGAVTMNESKGIFRTKNVLFLRANAEEIFRTFITVSVKCAPPSRF